MTNPELTIIIPCYNCTKTLTEAVDSCYIQNLDSFEIVLVDDGSTDDTYALMEELKNKHGNIRIFKNEKNLGGGATRNRAVAEAQADIIFCLDSDDMLPEGSLSKMFSYIKEKGCDAVGIHKSIKFRGNDTSDIIRIDEFGFVGEQVPYDSLIQRPETPLNPLYSTFMIRKRVFSEIMGYPTHHGFDTQGLAWRFLLNGHVAYTCPDVSYLHRLYHAKSYYVREYESGKINHNWIYVFEEFMYALTDNVSQEIRNYDPNSYGNIYSDIISKYNKIFKDTFPKTQREYFKNLTSKENDLLNSLEKYWLGVYYFNTGRLEESFRYLIDLQDETKCTPLIAHRIYRSAKALQKESAVKPHILKKAEEFMRYTKYGSQTNLYTKIYRKIYKLIKRII